jgi:tRNA1Val (adenine37-N6)-methyltransferase
MSTVAPIPWPEDARYDRLIGDWHIYQRTGGHRTSTDDLITAWYAVHRSEVKPARYLDLGCGIGSVLLMVTHKLKPPVARGIEGQEQSAAMAQRAIAELPAHAVDLRVDHGDFRNHDLGGTAYDLVTGSPPYFPPHAGTLPKDPQRRACRFEIRGGVEAYLQAAARVMNDSGRFYLVFQTLGCSRVLAAADESGLYLTGQADFHMRLDRNQPFLSVFEFSRATTDVVHRFSASVRDENGNITQEYQRIRQELGVDRERS